MANNLNRTIAVGEEVILLATYFKSGIDLVFICESGFGLSEFTVGKAIYGTWKADGLKSRIEGWMIDKKATEVHQHASSGEINS